jgi:hypothetical protein
MRSLFLCRKAVEAWSWQNTPSSMVKKTWIYAMIPSDVFMTWYWSKDLSHLGCYDDEIMKVGKLYPCRCSHRFCTWSMRLGLMNLHLSVCTFQKAKKYILITIITLLSLPRFMLLMDLMDNMLPIVTIIDVVTVVTALLVVALVSLSPHRLPCLLHSYYWL